jgi:hypothetical protein
MAADERSGEKRSNRSAGAAGTDDIQRGNVGTGDQGPGDVSPDQKVDSHTGEMKPQPTSGEKRRST